MNEVLQNGIQLAQALPKINEEGKSLSTLEDLLIASPKRIRNTGPSEHSAAAKFLDFVEKPANEVPIHLLETEMEGFTRYLEAGRYKKATIRAYRYALKLLLKRASQLGWDAPATVMPPDWAVGFEIASAKGFESAKAIKSIIRFAIRLGRGISTFSEDDLAIWSQEEVQSGKLLASARLNAVAFRKLLSRPDVVRFSPLIKRGPIGYGVPLREMHPKLRQEIEALVGFLTDEFEPGRRGGPLRIASAEKITDIFSRFTGYVQKVHAGSPIEGITNLLQPDLVKGYLKWMIKERKAKGEALFVSFSALHAALKRHPSYKDLDLTWLLALIGDLPRTSRTEIDQRKEKKRISYAAADAIPGMIRRDRERAKNLGQAQLAISLRNELLMLWLVILPWRQRNLREMRICGGPHPNLQCKPIPSHSSATKPRWLIQQEIEKPGSPVWQIYFSRNETKSKNEFLAFLPKELAHLTQEYLSCRHTLLPAGTCDPGTLFISDSGKALRDDSIRTLVQQLASRYAGAAVNPHLFRDIVAYGWLENNPEDYLTVSKLLWHKDVAFTIKTYGSKFNESTGIARMDDYRARRKAA